MNALLRYDPAPLDFRELIAASVAAPLLGKHINSLTRLCREPGGLKDQGKAFLTEGPDGGQEQWFIIRTYHANLAAGAIVDVRQIESDLSPFSVKQREGALQRRECVIAFRRCRNHPFARSMKDALSRLIDDLREQFRAIKISRTRIYEWHDLYACPADLIKLVDFRGGARDQKGCAEAWHRFAELYLHQNQPSKKQCWREVRDAAKENNWRWCSYASCVRQLDERIPPAEQAKHREPVIYRQQLSPFIAQRVEAWDAGECWVGDHKELDLLCRFGNSIVRPWATCWMDWRTRKIVGWELSDNPNSTTILGALRHGLKDATNFGGPACVWIDNGKDYDAWMFHGQTKQQRRSKIAPNVDEPGARGIFGLLGIEAHFSTAYNPNGKARLERKFRDFKAFSDTFNTSTGDSAEVRPELLPEILKLGHLIPAFKEVRERFAAYIAGYNANADHSIDDLIDGGEKLSPGEALTRWHATTRVLADPKALDYLLMHWHRPVPVGRNGITISLMGERLHYGQYCKEIERFKALSKADRKSVVVAYDPDDLSSVKLFDLQGHHVADVKMNYIGGHHHGTKIDSQILGEQHREKTRYNRQRKLDRKNSITHILTTEEQLAHRANVKAIESRQVAPATPGTIQLIQTPLDGVAEQIEKQQLRKAVGAAESNDAFDQLRKCMSESKGRERFEYICHAERMQAKRAAQGRPVSIQEAQELVEAGENFEPESGDESLIEIVNRLRKEDERGPQLSDYFGKDESASVDPLAKLREVAK